MNASKIKHTGTSLLQRSRRCCCKDAAVDLPLAIASSNRGLVRKIWGCNTNNNLTTHTNYINSSTRQRFLSSSSKGSSGNKKPKLSTPGSGSLGGMWYTPTTAASSSASRSTTNKPLNMGRYGLKRLDYATMKPPVWTAPPHPPTKTLAERVVFPASLVIAAGIGLLVYMNPEEEDMKDYWKRVESGQILLDDDDYDDDDEFEDDDEE